MQDLGFTYCGLRHIFSVSFDMPFPDLEYGDKQSLDAFRLIIRSVLKKKGHGGRPTGLLHLLACQMLACYDEMDSFASKFTGPICRLCPMPCCVNRHAFPDVEDLIFYEVSGIGPPDLVSGLKDTNTCVFLTKKGCMLPRPMRSYRCTWYFCEDVLDAFESRDPRAYREFEYLLSVLSKTRCALSHAFYELDPTPWKEFVAPRCIPHQ